MEASVPPDPHVDIAFPTQGKSVPLDHGYVLYAAVSRVVPELHAQEAWGIHPIRGIRTAPGQLTLDRSSAVKVRAPASDIAKILPLAGATLDLDGQRMVLAPPRVFPLVPGATLRARLVTIKGFHEEPEPFVEALRRQLAAVPELGQDPERVEVAVGARRVMRVKDKTVVGFQVELTGLEATASLAIQIAGIGGRPHMGAGIFVPPGRGR
jgi:CRISPR-associated protein Cas6